MKRIPIKEAKNLSKKYGYDQVIVIALHTANNHQHVTTFGRTTVDSCQAAQGGNYIKRHFLNWPKSRCLAEPTRVRKLRDRIKELTGEGKRLEKLFYTEYDLH